MQSMMGGHLDIAYVGTAPPITAISQGLDAKIVAAVQTQGSDLVLRPELADDYTSPSDLRGLKIATFPPGSIQDIVLKKFLMDNDVEIEDVTIVPIGPGDAITAIGADRVDAVFLPHPGPAIIELEGNGKVVASSGDMWQDHACCCLVVSDELIEKHPAMVEQIIRTHIQIAVDKAGLNQKDLAYDTSIPASRIKRYLNKPIEIPLDDLMRLDQALDLDPNILFDNESPVGQWQSQQKLYDDFQSLPEEIQEFIKHDDSQEAILAANRLMGLDHQKMHEIAESLKKLVDIKRNQNIQED